jgi:hypothetical protein
MNWESVSAFDANDPVVKPNRKIRHIAPLSTGRKRTSKCVQSMSALPESGHAHGCDIRLVPKADIAEVFPQLLRSSGLNAFAAGQQGREWR